MIIVLETTTAPSPLTFYQYYAANLRAAMFTGFFTLTGFLFAIKAFLIVNMKKELYETEEYQKEVVQHRQLNPKISFYGPLDRLSKLMIVTIMLSLATSISQFSLGLFVKTSWSAVVCLSIGVVTAIFLCVELFLIRSNLKRLFRYLESRAMKQHYPKSQSDQNSG
jgi:hypothetical protein